MAVTVKVTGTREMQRTMRLVAQDFPKQAARALNTTARKSVSQVRKRVTKQMKIKQKVLKERVRYRGATVKRLRASVWFGTRAGVDTAEVSGIRRRGKRQPIESVLPRAKAYTATMTSGEQIEYIRTRNYARPAMEQETRVLMRDFYPGELKRLVGVTIQRRARRKR